MIDNELMRNKKIRVLHLLGSPSSAFYYDMSFFYAKGTISLFEKQEEFEHMSLIYTMEEHWYFQSSIGPIDNQNDRLDLPAALQRVCEWKPSIMIPYIYCFKGLTHCRAIFELLGIGYTGSSPDVMALTSDKWKTRAILDAASVPVPSGESISRGISPTLSPPFVVKPCCEDNSRGISIVNDFAELEDALDFAFQHDEQVLCEQYIELGREIRVAVLETLSGGLELLPCIEYLFEEDGQIRNAKMKWEQSEDGRIIKNNATKNLVCPTQISLELETSIKEYAFRAFRALGAKYCCVFDIRVAPDEKPYFIEAGCYCTMNSSAAVPVMAKAKGMERIDLFKHLLALVQIDREKKQNKSRNFR